MKKFLCFILAVILAASAACALACTAYAEGEEKVVELTEYSINGFYAFEADNAPDVYEGASGQFLRMSYKGKRYTSAYFSSTSAIDANGLYRVQFDVRTSADFVTSNLFVALLRENLSQPVAWTVAGSKDGIALAGEPLGNGFYRITLDFKIDDYFSRFYKYMKIGYACTDSPSGYIDIDNIRIFKGQEMQFDKTVNIDNTAGGDFENFETVPYVFDRAGWTLSYYNLPHNTENSVVLNGENKVLKLYSSTSADATITKSVSVPGLKNAGWYMLKLDLMGGGDFYSDNIGFRLQSADQAGYHAAETNIPASAVKRGGWTTVEVPFYVGKTSSSAWINFDLWCFMYANGAEHKSAENYLLVDNIAFYKAVSDVTYGENLLVLGDIEGFSAKQGRVEVPLMSTDGYAYSRELIPQSFLKNYDEKTKLTAAWGSQNYLGTIDLDIPPEFTDADGYYAMKFIYDGKSMVKTYSSATYLLHMFDFSVNNTYRLGFDYKVKSDDTDIMRFAFVSVDNEDDFMIDLYTAVPGENKTAGVNKNIYTYTVTENGDGWRHVELVFRPDIGFKTRVNSMRFLLMTNFNEKNEMCIANFALTEYSDSPLNKVAVKAESDVSGGVGVLTAVLIAAGAVLVIGAVVAVLVIVKKRGGKRA